VARRRSDSAAGSFFGHPHLPEDFGHRSDAFKTSLSEVKPLKSRKNHHWHFVLQPTEDGGMSNILRWVTLTHTQRYHARYGTSGYGHVYQGRFKGFPIQDNDHFLVVARYVERNAVRAGLVERAEDWQREALHRWLSQPEPDPKLLFPWPLARLPNWVKRVNEPLSDEELAAVRWSVKRGSPFGSETWIESIARRFALESTLGPGGRSRVRPLPNKES
jgi:putative transposase